MTTISERLRAIDEAAMYEAPATTHATVNEGANTIDALVAALEITSGMYERATGLPMPPQAYRALALARKGGG